jgi:molybdopterin-guanine dinucleotide biosynthesis protein A
VDVAGLLLTGGASRRMGADKALLPSPGEAGATLAQRSAALLEDVCSVALEVGPGVSGLPAVADDQPGAGPLAAVATGHRALMDAGWEGAVLVVATDLPLLDVATLRWLAEHPASGSVVPVAGGHPQPLCARWSADDLALAARLVESGRRALRELLAEAHPSLAAVDVPGARLATAVADADTPDDARRLGVSLPAVTRR